VVVLTALLSACAHAPKKTAPPPAPAPATVVAPAAATAPAPEIQATAPQRYTVKKGDTLWGIANMYLKDAWLWPDIWYANPDIKNPHLIYPGDVIILGYTREGRPMLSVERNGAPVTAVSPPPAATGPAPAVVPPSSTLPITKLKPEVHYLPLSAAVIAIPLEGIRPFLTKTRVIDKSELTHAGYLLSSFAGGPITGGNEELYARDLKPENGTRYDIYRLGDEYVDPDSGDNMGYEATYIGSAAVEAWGDPTKLFVSSAVQEARQGDRFLPASGGTAIDLSFFPHSPGKTVNGQIMAVLGGVAQIGQYNVVVLNRGSADGLEPGTVLGIYRKGFKVDDPNGGWFNGSVKLPTERSGTLMVFRTFDKVSYALVMQATHEIHLDDLVANP
jgi:hypothetical protein